MHRWPALVGANRTVTVHDVCGPLLVVLQVSLVMANAAEPDNVGVSDGTRCSPADIKAATRATTPPAGPRKRGMRLLVA